MVKDTLAKQLFEIGAIKFGQFKLKSGILSPIYVDLRMTISYPSLLKKIGDVMWDKVFHTSFQVLCGVPYTALPIATHLSLEHNIPMVLRRREMKEHGTGNLIEGVIKPGETCLVIEDLITSGASILETIQPLEQVGLKVKDVVIFLDREQGGRDAVTKRGYHLHAATTISELLHSLETQQCIPAAKAKESLDFIKATQVKAKELAYA